jgi:hypothetical protein
MLTDEELHNVCAARNTIRVMKSRRIRRVGHVARMETMKNSYKILVGKPEELGVDGKIILEWISWK